MTFRNPLVLLAIVALTACSTCDESTVSDGGVDSGTIVVTPTTQCRGDYTSLNREQLEAESKSGACTSDLDLDGVCVNRLDTIAGECGLNCYLAHTSDGEAVISACTSTCIASNTTGNPIDSECRDCFGTYVVCSVKHCLSACAGGAASTGCVQCQAAYGCTAMFFSCSGLPASRPGGDGGVDGGADASTSDASTDDGGADASTDDAGADASTDDGGADASTDDGGADASIDDGGADASVDLDAAAAV